MRLLPTTCFAVAAVLLFVSVTRFRGMVTTAADANSSRRPPTHRPSPAVAEMPPQPQCGNYVCESPHESIATCPSDCPGVTTPLECGEEPHSDPAGEAVAWGSAPENRVSSASECCQRCLAHAKNPKNKNKPCNSWVFCYMPHCWALDGGNTHTFGECWLKWQVDPQHALFGQRGKYTDVFRSKYRNVHLTGKMPDGTPRNLSVPTHVPWTGGVINARVSYPTVTWETDIEGLMTSSTGERIVPWRAWETRAQNLARGVKAEQMPGT